MELQPVQEVRTPRYPTRREVLAGAATFAFASFCGRVCVFAASADGGVTVAPVFEHGEGRGATGCIVVSPPVFLSEEEAMQIIREELAKHGINLKGGETLEGVRIPERMEDVEENGKGRGTKESERKIIEITDEIAHGYESLKPKPLRLSGVDSEKKVMIELVWEGNYSKVGGVLSGSTVQDYDFKDVARYVAAKVKQQGKTPIYFGVFYDPAVKPNQHAGAEDDKKEEGNWRDAWEKAEKRGKKDAGMLLRAQAQDFVAWLKEKKAIP